MDSLNPKDWLHRAKSNLLLGEKGTFGNVDDILIEDFCFNLQQSVEKSLKALLIKNNLEYPKTHSISKIITILINNGVQVPDNIIKTAPQLTAYAVETRYPDDYNEITDTEYKEALEIAQNVYNWVENKII
ncbi:MAG: HEPN domain-containing protein [Candidatus Gastranaerophilaceae bacterium]|jgi:HEPN domain-containing protein